MQFSISRFKNLFKKSFSLFQNVCLKNSFVNLQNVCEDLSQMCNRHGIVKEESSTLSLISWKTMLQWPWEHSKLSKVFNQWLSIWLFWRGRVKMKALKPLKVPITTGVAIIAFSSYSSRGSSAQKSHNTASYTC